MFLQRLRNLWRLSQFSIEYGVGGEKKIIQNIETKGSILTKKIPAKIVITKQRDIFDVEEINEPQNTDDNPS